MISMEQIIVRLSELGKLYAGGDAPKEVSPEKTEEFCYPIYSNGLEEEGLYGFCKKSTMKANTITVSARGTIGAAFYRKEPFLPIVRLITIEPDTSKVDSWYLYYYLQMNKLEGYGTSQQQLTLPFMKKRKFLIYKEIDYQKKIATVLNNYDQLIENNNKRIKLLEDMAESLYKEWFLKSKEICKTIKLVDLMKDFFNGGWGKDEQEKKEKNEGFVIRGTDIPDVLNSYYDNVPLRFHSDNDIKNKQLQENDIIMELSNGNINNIGRTLLITKDMLYRYGNLMCASFCKTMRFNNNKDALSALLLIRYLQDSGKMFFYKNTGTNGINNFNFKRFLKQEIYILDDEIYSIIKDIYKLANKYRQENYNLMKQRDSLLPRLMIGKLSVEGKEVI